MRDNPCLSHDSCLEGDVPGGTAGAERPGADQAADPSCRVAWPSCSCIRSCGGTSGSRRGLTTVCVTRRVSRPSSKPPTVQITIGVYPKEGGECVLSQTIPASEVPALAATVQDQIEAECFAQMRFVNQEISRFMEIVSNLQHQNSKLFALRRPACTATSPS